MSFDTLNFTKNKLRKEHLTLRATRLESAHYFFIALSMSSRRPILKVPSFLRDESMEIATSPSGYFALLHCSLATALLNLGSSYIAAQY